MGIEERPGLETAPDLMGRLAYLCHWYMYRSVFEASQEGLLRRYFELSAKGRLSDLESEELDFILELSCHDRKLAMLTYAADQHLNELAIAADNICEVEIEQIRGRALENILSGLAGHSDLRKATSLGQLSSSSENAQLGSAAVPQSKSAIAQASRALGSRLSYTLLVRCCSKLAEIKPLWLTRQCFLCLSFSVLGAVFAIYRDDISRMAKMLLSTVDISAPPLSLSHNTIRPSVDSTSVPSVPNECRNELVGWTNSSYDGKSTFYEKTFRSSESTAAHEFLPPGSKIYLKSEVTNHSVVVKVNEKLHPVPDQDKSAERSESIRVSYSAARQLDMVEDGITPVVVKHVEVRKDEIDKLSDDQRDQLAQFQSNCGVLTSDTGGF